MNTAVSAFVLLQGKFVVVKRGPGRPYAGLWSFPGGRVEAQETMHEALEREVKEETNLVVVAGKLLAIVASSGFNIAVMNGDYRSGTLQAGDDAVDARWVSIDELEELETTPGLKDLARKLCAHPDGS